MTRTHLLGAASAVALACLSTVTHAAQPGIFGGGSTLAQFDYIDEFAIFNPNEGTTKPTFSTYWEAGSGTGQQAFLNDDLSCDINKVTGNNGGACGGNAGATGNTVQYGASDATLSSTQISTWTTSSFGQTYAGNLIQLPSMGVGISIPVNNSAITSNGQLTLSDNDLCGIFSAKITNFNQITDSKTTPAPGAFNVVYRSDGSGTSFILTSHLASVCTGSNSNITFTATTKFASLFTTVPGSFIGESGSNGVADEMAGCNGALPNALAYLSPDFTTVDSGSDAHLDCTINGSNKSPLVVAGVVNATNKVTYIPTVANITSGLTHAKAGTGQNLTPPANAQDGADPTKWVPVLPIVTVGYPVVGYTTFDFAQCYAPASVSAAIRTFLTDHYTVAQYTSVQATNGFVSLKASAGSQYLKTIQQNILKNSNGWATDIGNATVCKSKHGR